MLDIKIKELTTNNYVTKSKLPSADYVINPYIGCLHGCKYCYASFMKRFTNHKEKWGTFIDIKQCERPINTHKLIGKTIFLSSVTDCYNPVEEKYQLTRNILKQLIDIDCHVNISTKSNLILRDLDLLKQLKNVTVAISINTLDETFQKDMDQASSINQRIETLQKLHEAGIYTILFMSPIFPYITDWQQIIKTTKSFVDEYWFENLNLRGDYKQEILKYIEEKYQQYYSNYLEIYQKKNKSYWVKLSNEIETYCQINKLVYHNFFYHEQLVKE